MEKKIGEIFECNGEWYQCVKGDMYDYCKGCPSFENLRCTTLYGNKDCWLKATCEKLEKVGEPYFNGQYGEVLQEYKYYIPPITPDLRIHIIKLGIVGIEIKQRRYGRKE